MDSTFLLQLLEDPGDVEQLKNLLVKYFPSYEKEIFNVNTPAAAFCIFRRTYYLLGLKNAATGEIVSGALTASRELNRMKTLEVQFFASLSSYRRKGLGTKCFLEIIKFARKTGHVALLCECTNKTTPWWVSRAKFSSEDNPFAVCSTVLRSDGRVKLEDVELSDNEKLDVSSLFSDYGIDVREIPKRIELESLYFEKLLRNRYGKIAKGQVFKGLPYKFDIESSNHVWFLIRKDLMTKLGCVIKYKKTVVSKIGFYGEEEKTESIEWLPASPLALVNLKIETKLITYT